MDVGVHLGVEVEQLDSGAHIELSLSITLLVSLEIHQLLEIDCETILEKRLLHLFAEQKIVVSPKELSY